MSTERSLSNRTITFILAGGEGKRLHPLTRDRAKPALPFAGSYRLIDFTLSNCHNSRLQPLYVLTQYRAESLEHHLQLGWKDVRVRSSRPGSAGYRGTADAVFQNIHLLLEDEWPEQVLILASDHVYRMDYRNLLRFHAEKGAALTIAGVEVPRLQATQLGVMGLDAHERIVDFAEKPAHPRGLPGRPDHALASMGIYVFDPQVLIRHLAEDAAWAGRAHDFGRDIIPRLVGRGEAAYGYPFCEPGGTRAGYWRDVGTLDSYWRASMDLVEKQPPCRLDDAAWPFHTGQARPAAPVVSSSHTHISRTLLSPGGSFHGARIDCCVLSPEVEVRAGAEVEEAVLLEEVKVGRDARLRRVVVDRGVTIPAGARIGFDREQDRRHFVVSEEHGVVVVTRQHQRREASVLDDVETLLEATGRVAHAGVV